jgi:hypothetical protein
MLVYANTLHLTVGFDPVIACIGRWVEYKTHKFVPAGELIDGFKTRLKDGKEIEVVMVDNAEGAQMASVIFSHPDDTVSGRKWFVRIGVESKGGQSRVSVVLDTSDISVQAGASRAFATRPGVVTELVKLGKFAPGFTQVGVQTLRPDQFEAVAEEMEDPRRNHAIIIASVDPFSERCSLSLSKLAGLLPGLAVIYKIGKRDGFEFTKLVGKSKSAWGGAVNVIYPPLRGSSFTPTQLITPQAIAFHKKKGENPEDFLLYCLTHRFNLPHYAGRITQEQVLRAKLNQQLAAVLKDNRGKVNQAVVDALKAQVEQLNDQLAAAETNSEFFYNEHLKIQEENERLKNKLAALEHRLSKPSAPGTAALAENREFRSLDDVHEAVVEEMADALIFTNRAKKTFKESPFHDAARVYEAFDFLAHRLVPYFLGKLDKKQIDAQLEELGIEYRPHMSDTTLSSFDDYDAKYNGRKADFNKHLVIGTSRKPERCFRIHFEWDEDDKKIVVHHAGKHPTNSKT